jgi:hypothetical protein
MRGGIEAKFPMEAGGGPMLERAQPLPAAGFQVNLAINIT